MIFYLVTPEHRYTIDGYLRTFGRALRSRVQVLPYTRLLVRRRFADGSYVFTDLERLSPVERTTTAALADRLESAGARVLNHPARVLRRYELLRALHAAGINRFTAHRLAQRGEARLPAFLRLEDEHQGSLTPILRTPAALERAVAELPPDLDRARVIVVEYVHTADAGGVFRKYSSLRVGAQRVPRHVLFSHDWVDRTPDLVSEALAAEERDYIAGDPHAATLDRVFELARIDFGRVDYGVQGGAVQVWEINTNPMIMPLPEKIDPLRIPGQLRSAGQIGAAFCAIDTRGDGRSIEFRVAAASQRELRGALLRRVRSTAARWLNRGRKGRIWRRLRGGVLASTPS